MRFVPDALKLSCGVPFLIDDDQPCKAVQYGKYERLECALYVDRNNANEKRQVRQGGTDDASLAFSLRER